MSDELGASAGLVGGCFCGAIRYAIDADPIATYLCHCKDCQRSTGGPYSACVLISGDAFRITQGTPKRCEHAAESGNIVVREFCGDCGTPMFSNSPSRPQLRVVRAGTLDDRSGSAPQLHIWIDSALAWSVPEDGRPRLAKGPGSPER